MPAPIRLWIEITHHAAFRYGGWAYARQIDSALAGAAGGERNLTVGRLTLAALIAALNGLPPGVAVTLTSAAPAILNAVRTVLKPPPPEEAPAEDLDLWAQLSMALKGRAVSLVSAARAANTPSAFLGAWAEVGQDKA